MLTLMPRCLRLRLSPHPRLVLMMQMLSEAVRWLGGGGKTCGTGSAKRSLQAMQKKHGARE